MYNVLNLQREKKMYLIVYSTGEVIRKATAGEKMESIEAAKHDAGRGVIEVEVRREKVSCFVV